MDEPENQSEPEEPAIKVSPRAWFFLRLIVAVFFGAVFTIFSLDAGYSTAKRWPYMPQQRTQMMLESMRSAIENYRTEHHDLPRTMDQFGSAKDLDAWGHPFVYAVHGKAYLLVSYGEDGKPGGTGWDTDLTSANVHPPGAVATVHQFLTSPITHQAVQGAWGTGILAFLLCFVTIRPASWAKTNVAQLILRLVFMLFAAWVVGGLITALDLPLGH